RVTREAADPSRANPISLARSSLPRKPPRIIRQSESPQPQNARKFSRILNESGYTVFEGKRKISPTTRTRTVLIADIMVLEREAALKPARQCAPLTGCGA